MLSSLQGVEQQFCVIFLQNGGDPLQKLEAKFIEAFDDAIKRQA